MPWSGTRSEMHVYMNLKGPQTSRRIKQNEMKGKWENNFKFFEEKLPNPIVCIRWNRCGGDKLNFF